MDQISTRELKRVHLRAALGPRPDVNEVRIERLWIRQVLGPVRRAPGRPNGRQHPFNHLRVTEFVSLV